MFWFHQLPSQFFCKSLCRYELELLALRTTRKSGFLAMKTQRFLSLPVFAVFFVMGFVYYSTIFIFIEDRLGLKSSAGFLNALVFSCFALMSFISFISCIIMEPGHVPSNFVLEIEHGEVSDQGTNKNVSFYLYYIYLSLSCK